MGKNKRRLSEWNCVGIFPKESIWEFDWTVAGSKAHTTIKGTARAWQFRVRQEGKCYSGVCLLESLRWLIAYYSLLKATSCSSPTLFSERCLTNPSCLVGNNPMLILFDFIKCVHFVCVHIPTSAHVGAQPWVPLLKNNLLCFEMVSK